MLKCRANACYDGSDKVAFFVMFDGAADSRWYAIGRSKFEISGIINLLLPF